jgi:hypothetical protein
MNGAHLHLLVNHIPVLWLPLAVAFLVWALLRDDPRMIRYGFAALVVVGAFTALAYFTGEPAEHIAEHMTGVSRRLIHEHEEAAELASVITGAVGLAALIFLLAFRRAVRIPRWSGTLLVLAGAVAFALMARAANLGGLIRHPEIHNPVPATPPQALR